MAGSKKKPIKLSGTPESRGVVIDKDPNAFYKERPSWVFNMCDTEWWPITQKAVGNDIWTELIPFLQSLETQKWSEILIDAKKNHSVTLDSLNKAARDRLDERQLEPAALYSLRLSGTHRLYGYMQGPAFVILWFDTDHGDNETCVCRSRKKNT